MATPRANSCWGKEEGCSTFQGERGHVEGHMSTTMSHQGQLFKTPTSDLSFKSQTPPLDCLHSGVYGPQTQDPVSTEEMEGALQVPSRLGKSWCGSAWVSLRHVLLTPSPSPAHLGCVEVGRRAGRLCC